MSVKGYATSQKLDRVPGEYACIVPTGDSLNALAVQSSMYVYLVGSDTVDAGTTASTIIAAGIGAVARRGDIIRFTSGTFSGVEVKVLSTATNSVTLTEDLSAAPATNVTFAIHRFIHPVASSGGSPTMALSFTRNGASQIVTEDTVTPANNRPLPVQIESVGGSVTINAGDLDVNINHDGLNYSSTRIGDGTTLVGVTSANELKSFVGSTGAGYSSVRVGDGTTLLGITSANEAKAFLSSTGAGYSSVRIGDGSNIATVTGDGEFKTRINSFTGRSASNAPVRHDYTSNVTTLAYTQLVASTTASTNKLQIFDSSGQTLVLAVGAAGAEVDKFFIFPGGVEIEFAIPIASRISIKAVSANATSGECSINFLT